MEFRAVCKEENPGKQTLGGGTLVSLELPVSAWPAATTSFSVFWMRRRYSGNLIPDIFQLFQLCFESFQQLRFPCPLNVFQIAAN